MLGARLRQARLGAGLSLEGLAAKLEEPISRQALSKYETGAAQPSPSRIAELSIALNVRVSALLTEPTVNIRWVAYRKLARLSKSRQEQITAVAMQRLEGELKLRELFHLGERHNFPGPIDVQNLNDCDYAAAAVRMRWNLGYRPVDSLTGAIEEHGGTIVAWAEPWGFDGLSGWADRSPVLVLNEAMPPDRFRLNAAHEIGHLVMTSTNDARQDEAFAFRFAASFLVPAEAARHELGTHRRGMELRELGLLKQRWGLSMQGWIRRARDLDIISDDLYRTLNIRFRSAGWHRKEPIECQMSESPALFRRLVLRALTEGMITAEEADHLQPGVTADIGTGLGARTYLRDLARRPLEERHRVLRDATASVDADELEAWDANSDDFG